MAASHEYASEITRRVHPGITSRYREGAAKHTNSLAIHIASITAGKSRVAGTHKLAVFIRRNSQARFRNTRRDIFTGGA